MNIWDPIWKENKEDNIDDPIYKMKPVLINLDGIAFRESVNANHTMLWNKFYLDIEFNEDYINTLDVDKRKIWVLDDGGCTVNCQISSTGLSSTIEDKINQIMAKKHQRKWVVQKITNGVRLSVDMPIHQIFPKVEARTSAHFAYLWNFGSVKLLIPEPIQFDSNVVTISAIMTYAHVGENKFGTTFTYNVQTEYTHFSNITNYKLLNNLQLEKSSLVALHKFTIESAKNLVNEVKDVISVPFPINLNYVLENHPEYPITYARARNNVSIGSSSKPKDKCHMKMSPMTLADQTQCKGRSLNKLGIVGKILSIIKRRKREIK